MSAQVKLKHKLKNQSALTRMLPEAGRNGGDGGGGDKVVPFEMATSWPEI